MRRRVPPTYIIFFLALLIAGCGRQLPPTFHNTDITGAAFGRALALQDQHRQARTLADFRGKAVVVYFGYTTCPDVCPTALARFAAVMKKLGKQAAQVQVVFVTLDPERDTPEKLAAYVNWFDPSFIALYGDTAATAAATREFKIFSAKKEVSGGLGYVIDHSSGAYIFDPAGHLRLFVKDDTPLDSIVADLKLLLDQ